MAQKHLSITQAKSYARDYVRHLTARHRLPVTQAYLFGSFAKGKPRAWSDIDVCVISPKFNKTDPLEYLWTKRRDVDVTRGIEPYGLPPQDFVPENPIAYHVQKFGVPLMT